MWGYIRGLDQGAWVQSPFYLAPMYFPTPLFGFTGPPGFPTSDLPVPFSPIGMPSPHIMADAHRSQDGPPDSTPPPQPHHRGHHGHHPHHGHNSITTTMHTSHHYTSHHLYSHSHRRARSPERGTAERGHAKLRSRSRSQPKPQIQQGHSHHSAYSKCTGRKKALCIGINYRGQSRELHGCINDAKNVSYFLIKHYNYKSEDVHVLVDDAPGHHNQPTRENILEAMHWLVRDAKPHDSLFFHYSGHGGQTTDLDGDEVDGLDEVIFPVDYKHAGHIVDDDMHKIMVKSLPKGCRLTAVFDSCHSGSALDLPYLYHSDGRIKGHSEVTPSHMKEKSSEADVMSWSGCMDSQTSADAWEAGAAVGAMSYAFMKALTDKPDQSYQQLLVSIRSILKKNYSQKPQLSASHRIDTSLRFIM